MSTRSVASAATQTIEMNNNTSNLNKKTTNGSHVSTEIEGSHLDVDSKLYYFHLNFYYHLKIS